MKRAAFIADPFGFAKQLSGQRRSGWQVCSKEEVDQFLANNLSDPERVHNLGPHSALLGIPSHHTISHGFHHHQATWKESQEVDQSKIRPRTQ